MKNILVRADSSSKIGIGHIMRDLVLIKKFSNSNIIFACQNLKGNINQKILNFGFKVEVLKSNDIQELDELIKSLKIDLLIVDHYEINYHFEKEIKKENPKLKVLSFDDTYEKHYCDILLNHNIYAQEKKYKNKVPTFCELRCGKEYTLIRDEFKNLRKRKIKDSRKRVLISFGGSDFDNLSLKVLKTIKDEKKIKIYILTTSANKNIKTIKNFIKNQKNMKLIVDSNKVAKLINKIDLAIVSPSTILHEIIYLNKKFIAIQTASNQKFMMKYLKKSRYPALEKFSKDSFFKIFKKSI